MAHTPKRIQMRRDRPWRCDHPDAVIVARPGKWGNPFKIGDDASYHFGNGFENLTVEQAVHCYREWLDLGLIGTDTPGEPAPLHELHSKDLACWCPLDQPCHADVLLEIANKDESHE